MTDKSNKNTIIIILSLVICTLLIFEWRTNEDTTVSNRLNVDNNVHSFEDITTPTVIAPKIAYVFAGSIRSFVCPKVHWSIRSHLIDSLGGEPHVFIRTTLEDNTNDQKTGVGNFWTPSYQTNEVTETLRLLNPTEIEYFQFQTQLDEMKVNYPGRLHTLYRDNDQRRYSMFYHRCMAYKMMLKFEKQHNMRFDWVVLARLDAAWIESLLPIQSYVSDRVWLTETGFDLFNDQFMLIPRQFSDYLYDLVTKVKKGVYCLGGPDVEKWKCNATELILRRIPHKDREELLDHCCADVFKRNSLGYSEIIHKRHLMAGKIPVSIGHFPVVLTRINTQQHRDTICTMECERLLFNFKSHYSYYHTGSYAYFGKLIAPDTRGHSLSYNDHTKCEMIKDTKHSLWNPLSAAVIHSGGGNVVTTGSSDSNNKGSKEVITTTSRSYKHQSVDYSKSLYSQWDELHPSVLTNHRYFEIWRIHPTWNAEGCLSYNFNNSAIEWNDCRDHFKMKGGFRHDAQQMWFLQVIPHAEHVERGPFEHNYHTLKHLHSQYVNTNMNTASSSNVTRIMIPNREPRVWDRVGGIKCLTIWPSLGAGAKVLAQDCLDDRRHPTQLFRSIQGLTRGSHSETTVGRIHVANRPELCIARNGNIEYGLTIIPQDGELILLDCYREAQQQRVLFEFQLMG